MDTFNIKFYKYIQLYFRFSNANRCYSLKWDLLTLQTIYFNYIKPLKHQILVEPIIKYECIIRNYFMVRVNIPLTQYFSGSTTTCPFQAFALPNVNLT